MAGLFSADWLASELRDPLAEAAAVAGVEASFSRSVSGGPDGEVRYTARVAGGAVIYEVGAADEVDVQLTDTFANAVKLWDGELDPAVAFMQGKTKVAGHTGRWLDLLAASSSSPS